jgi:predicted NBD/HSP70 family sugar kinase
MTTRSSAAIHPAPVPRRALERQRAARTGDDWPHAVMVDVLLNGPMARADLARRMKLSNATITRVTSQLLTRGLLVEKPSTAPSGVGRPTVPLDVPSSAHRFLGVRITDSGVQCVLTDFRADVLRTAERTLDDHEPEAVVAAITTMAEELAPTSDLAGVGVCLGGKIDDEGTVVWAPYLNWQDVRFGTLLQRALPHPVTVENDLVALTQAEHWFGHGRGLGQFAVVTLGVGIGLGVVIDNQLVRGPDFGLGLAGHLPLAAEGPTCPRGHVGCAKAMLSTPGIAARLSERLGRPVDFDEFVRLAAAGDPEATAVAGASGRALGVYLSLIANIVMPQAIVLTGEGIELARLTEPVLRGALDALRNRLAAPVPLRIHPTDAHGWARGAAVAAITDYVGRSA